MLLVVNVASACGLTPQYESLEKIYETDGERGLVVLGFPSNQFGAQEPGSNDEIVEFCSTKYGVRFPMFEKIDVNGEARHPLYRELVAAQPAAAEKSGDFRDELAKYGVKTERPDDILWNFEKFLVSTRRPRRRSFRTRRNGRRSASQRSDRSGTRTGERALSERPRAAGGFEKFRGGRCLERYAE